MYPNHGFDGINSQPNDNNAFRVDASAYHHGRNVSDWIEESTNAALNSDFTIQFRDSLAASGMLSPIHSRAGTDQRFEPMHFEHNISQQASSSKHLNCLDLSAAFEANDVDAGLHSNPYGQGEPDADFPATAGFANIPMLIARNSNAQPTVYNPFDFNIYDLAQNGMPIAPMLHPTQPFVHTPSVRTYQPFQLNTATSSWPGLTYSPTHIAREIDAFLYQESLRNNLAPALQLSENQLRNFAGLNEDYSSGTYFPGNMVSSSDNGGGAHSYQPSAIIWTPQGYMTEQYHPNFAEMISSIGPQGGYSRPHHQVPHMPGLMVRTERQPSPAPQRRTRIISEEVLVIERSVLYDETDDSSDAESMSYEVTL